MAVLQVVSVQPGMYLPAGYKTGAWNSALCSCCEDMDTCCFGFWCPWCLSCQTSSDFGECLCLPMVEMGGSVPAIGLAMRTAMRERYNIQGSMCEDFYTVAFCNWCSWCQMHRELKIRKQQQAVRQVVQQVQQQQQYIQQAVQQVQQQQQYIPHPSYATASTSHLLQQ